MELSGTTQTAGGAAYGTEIMATGFKRAREEGDASGGSSSSQEADHGVRLVIHHNAETALALSTMVRSVGIKVDVPHYHPSEF